MEAKYRATVPQELTRVRTQAGLVQKGFGSGASESSVSRAERGQTICESTAIVICKVLGVAIKATRTLDDLFVLALTDGNSAGGTSRKSTYTLNEIIGGAERVAAKLFGDAEFRPDAVPAFPGAGNFYEVGFHKNHFSNGSLRHANLYRNTRE